MTTGLAVAVLCLLLVAQVTLSENPFAGWSTALAIMGSALALFVVWTMLSGDWSDSPARALVESNRALLYLLMLVFVGLHAGPPRGHPRLAALLRWVALAILVTSFIALLSRLLPATFPTKAGFNNARLQFPLTYWNAMGVFTALGVILATHLTASEREPACGAGRRGGGTAGRRRHALLLVLARGDRGGDRGHGAVSHPGASAGSGGRAGGGRRPAGGRAPRRLRRGSARPVQLHRRRREGPGPLAGRRGDRLRRRRRGAALADAPDRPAAPARGDRRPHAADRVRRGGRRGAARARRRDGRASTCRTASPTSTARSSRATRRPAAPTCARA